MTTSLVARVLAWAAAPDGRPPTGPVYAAADLTQPDPDASAMLGWLVADIAARLGSGTPPFGDARRVGPGALFLATAIGLRHDPVAANLLRITPRLLMRDDPWADCVARHAVAGPFALRYGSTDSDLIEPLIAASPLTELLYRPRKSGVDGARAAVRRLIARPSGANLVTAATAAPGSDAAVQGWRAGVVATLRRERPSLAIDVYLKARLWYGAEWDRRIAASRREVFAAAQPSNLTVATLRFWLPLADLVRAETARRGLAMRVPGRDFGNQDGATSLRDLAFLDPRGYNPAVALAERYRSVLVVPVRTAHATAPVGSLSEEIP